MTEGDNLDDLDPLAVSDRRVWFVLLRLVLFVILFVLPLLLLGATMAATIHPEGCGGG